MHALAKAVFLSVAGLVLGCAPAAAPPEPALWRVTDEDSEIWLFGSVHVLPPDLAWRTARLDAAFAAADELVIETDASAGAQPEFARLTAELGRLPEGQRLSDGLDADAKARLARVAALAGLDPGSLEPLRPWLAALQLSISFAIREGHAPSAGVESVLVAEAAAQQKRISYLESAEQQMRTLADLSPADEHRFFAATLRQIEEEPEVLDELDAAWARGDIDALRTMIEAQWEEAGPAVYESLIVRRNRAWADEVARRLEGDDDLFIAVGAAHLIGPDGVVADLRTRGIAVEGP